jgi:hypothetical protein
MFWVPIELGVLPIHQAPNALEVVSLAPELRSIRFAQAALMIRSPPESFGKRASSLVGEARVVGQHPARMMARRNGFRFAIVSGSPRGSGR